MTRDLKVILEGVFSLLIEEITTLIIIIGRDVDKISSRNIRIKYIKNYSFLGNYIKNSKICIGSGD